MLAVTTQEKPWSRGAKGPQQVRVDSSVTEERIRGYPPGYRGAFRDAYARAAHDRRLETALFGGLAGTLAGLGLYAFLAPSSWYVAGRTTHTPGSGHPFPCRTHAPDARTAPGPPGPPPWCSAPGTPPGRGAHGRARRVRAGERRTGSCRTLAGRPAVPLRLNGGGDFALGRRYLLPVIQSRPALSHPGGVYVITGPGTFSAAMVNALDLRRRAGAVLVGEATGARPNSYGEHGELRLPNSGLRVSYSTRYLRFGADADTAVVPDRSIRPTWEEFRAGRDPVLEWILAQPVP